MSVVTRRKTIVEDRDTVAQNGPRPRRRDRFFQAEQGVQHARVGQALKIADREMLENSYETYKQDFISVPYPITKGLGSDLRFHRPDPPGSSQQKPEEFVDASFISELEKSGFIKKLYERK